METKYIVILLSILVIIVVIKFSKKIIYFIFVGSIVLITFFLVTGCSKSDLYSTDIEIAQENTLTRVTDIPFLPESKIHLEESLILGEGIKWSGQLLITVKENKRDVFNFYAKNLKDYDWKEQTTIRGNTSILIYLGPENRVAIITIKKTGSGLLEKSSILISVSPFTDAFEEKVGDYINEKYLEITGE